MLDDRPLRRSSSFPSRILVAAMGTASVSSAQSIPAEGTAPSAVAPEKEPVPDAPAAQPSAVAPTAAHEPDPSPKLTLGAGAILWFYQPLTEGTKNNLEVFWANIVADGILGPFGLHLEPRFRDTKLRSFFAGSAWLQEAYGSAEVPYAKIKVGKVYSRLGLFWDNSFYGNVQVYDGMKLAPNYGISIEGGTGGSTGVNYVAQYFVIDGGTNVSLTGRDTLSIAGSHRRNEGIVRLEPFAALAATTTLKVGLSASSLQADLPDGRHTVYRGAADVAITGKGFGLWGEVLRQDGATVTDFPYAGSPATASAPATAGRASAKNDYILAGGEYTYDRFTLRYNFSLGSYADVSVKERMHVPAFSVKANDNLSLLTEVVFWDRSAPEGSSKVDRSLNVTLYGHF
jgi:hypothetical protein